MSDREDESLPNNPPAENLETHQRREFLLSLGKWSKVVIGGVLLGGVLAPGQPAKAWGNRGGGAGLWYNSSRGWGGWAEQPWDWNNGPLARPATLERPTVLEQPTPLE
jgi:hypothetical protein